MAMGPKGDPNPTESFQPPGGLGKFTPQEILEAEEGQSMVRIVICM